MKGTGWLAAANCVEAILATLHYLQVLWVRVESRMENNIGNDMEPELIWGL